MFLANPLSDELLLRLFDGDYILGKIPQLGSTVNHQKLTTNYTADI